MMNKHAPNSIMMDLTMPSSPVFHLMYIWSADMTASTDAIV